MRPGPDVKWWLAAAVLVGLLVRVPGVFWGWNFPTGWQGHHVDEYTHLVNAETLLNPLVPPRWPPHPYPKGLAVHVAPPLLAWEALEGRLLDGLPTPQAIVVTGRFVSVFYGVATIVVTFVLTRHLFRANRDRLALIAAWIVALGGLHVSQSHYFVADVPALFWSLLGTYLLYRDIEDGGTDPYGRLLAGAALCFGIAFGVKLVVASMPSLALAAVLARPRVYRLVSAAMFGVAGFVIVNANHYDTMELIRSMARTGGAPFEFSRWFSLLVYVIQLPSLISFPVLALAVPGTWMLTARVRAVAEHRRRAAIWLAIIVPIVLSVLLVVFTVNNFLRHLVQFVPWLAIAAAAALSALMDSASSRRWPPALVLAPVFAYLAIFVFDGERLFIQEPRNAAGQWLIDHVPQGTEFYWQGHALRRYKQVPYPTMGRPPVIVMEMHRANEVLSGMGWKNNMPADYRRTFGKRPKDEVEALQGLFKGTTEYREVARFSEHYWMPEFTLVERLLGNRSRNYLTEVVIFRRDGPAN